MGVVQNTDGLPLPVFLSFEILFYFNSRIRKINNERAIKILAPSLEL